MKKGISPNLHISIYSITSLIDLRKQVVPDGAKLINWTERKYMLVKLLRRLKGSDWLSQTDKELECHFLVNGKPFFMKKHSLKSSEKEKFIQIEEILKRYL